jgi:hypothetical protein
MQQFNKVPQESRMEKECKIGIAVEKYARGT